LSGKATVDALGGFDTDFKLPETPNLGYAYVYFEAKGRITGSFEHNFQIQEFRRPEYEVSTSVSQGPQMVGGSADVTASAAYYAGGGLGGAPVSWYVTAEPTSYTPPNRDDYVFGTWTPWWGWRDWWDEDSSPYQQPKSWNFSGTTDATGKHVLHMDFLSVSPSQPMSVVAYANVTDVNRQSWSSTATMLVHPSKDYIGLKTKRPFVDKGDPIDLDGIVTDLDGKADIGKAYEVKAVRLDWTYEKGKYTQKEVDPQSCTGTSTADPFKCSFTTKDGGEYQLTAITADSDGRKNQTQMTIWVAGGDMPPSRDIAQEQVNLIPDAKEYQDGDTAKILVQAPFHPAEGVMTVRRSGIVTTERFTIDGPTTTLEVPIKDAYVPNVYVQVDLVGKQKRLDDSGQPTTDLPDRPAYAVGVLNLPVPPKKRTLAVTVKPEADKVEPGAKTHFDVDVKDAAGKPVKDSQVALIVVDESILALTGYTFSSPIDVFYGGRDTGTRDYYYRGYVQLAQPDQGSLSTETTTASNAPEQDRDGVEDETVARGDVSGGEGYGRGAGGAAHAAAPAGQPPPPPPKSPMPDADKKVGGKDLDNRQQNGQPAPAVAVRSNFNPLAAFAPAVKTDAGGHATVDVTMPDNLTRYRVVAIAVAGERDFGKGESAVTARLPLMVRPSPP